MKRSLLKVILILLSFNGFSQTDKDEFGIKFSGFVKNDMFFDSRQTVSAREGHLLLYPKNKLLDNNGKDINAQANMNILAINTRLSGKITGPDAFGAKTSGLIEGAFFGHSESDVNGFRLRHAFAKLTWGKTELIAGQTWHPIFITEAYPGTVSFSTGVPFQPFSRSPQIRLTRYLGKLRLMAAVSSQRDFTSPGGSELLRNSNMPDFHVRIQYQSESASGNLFNAGIGSGYKRLKPRLATDSLYKANESVGSFSVISFLKYKTSPITVKAQGVWGQNMFDLLMMGGFAYKPANELTDLNIDHREYTTLDVTSCWIDIQNNNDKMELGIFAGMAHNLGAKDAVNACYARGDDIKYTYRVSPRTVFTSGKMKVGLEAEYTVAAYATQNPSTGELNIDSHRKVLDAEEIGNLRLLLSIGYFF